MDFLDGILNKNTIDVSTAGIRLLVSFIVGAIIGIEREAHRQPAGLRTHILICLGATLIMLLSIYIPQQFSLFKTADPGRIAAQVVSGIGFLGAGAIIKFGANIRGLTTAATIWAVAAIGLCVGAGMFVVALIGSVLILFGLIVVEYFEKKLFKPKFLKRIELTIDGVEADLDQFKKILGRYRIRISTVDMHVDRKQQVAECSFLVLISQQTDYNELTRELSEGQHVSAIKITQADLG